MRRRALWIVSIALLPLVALAVIWLVRHGDPDPTVARTDVVSGNARAVGDAGTGEAEPTLRDNQLRGSQVHVEFVGHEDVHRSPEVVCGNSPDVTGIFVPDARAARLVDSPGISVIVHPVGAPNWYVFGGGEVREDDTWFVRDVELAPSPHGGALFELWAAAADPPFRPGRTSHPPWRNRTGSWVVSEVPVLLRVPHASVTPPGWHSEDRTVPSLLSIDRVGVQNVDRSEPYVTVESLPQTSIEGSYEGSEHTRIYLLARPEGARRWLPVAREVPLERDGDAWDWRATDVFIPYGAQPGGRRFQLRAVATTIPILADQIDNAMLASARCIYSNSVSLSVVGWYPPHITIDSVESREVGTWEIAGSATDLPGCARLQAFISAGDGPWYWPQPEAVPAEAPRDFPDTRPWVQSIRPRAGPRSALGEDSSLLTRFHFVMAAMLEPMPPVCVDEASWKQKAIAWTSTEVLPHGASASFPVAQDPQPSGDLATNSRSLKITHIGGYPARDDCLTVVPQEAVVQCDQIPVSSDASLWVARRCLDGGGWSVARCPARASGRLWLVEGVEFGDPLPGQTLDYEVRAFIWPAPSAPHDPDIGAALPHASAVSPPVKIRVASAELPPGVVLGASAAGMADSAEGGGIPMDWRLLILVALCLAAALIVGLCILAYVVARRWPGALGRFSQAISHESEQTWPTVRASFLNAVIGFALLAVVLYMLFRFYPFYSLVLSEALDIPSSAGEDWAFFLLAAVAVAGTLLHIRSARASGLEHSPPTPSHVTVSAEQHTAGDGTGGTRAAEDGSSLDNEDHEKADSDLVSEPTDSAFPLLWTMTIFLWGFEGSMLAIYLLGRQSPLWIAMVGFFGGAFCCFIETMAFRTITGLLVPHAAIWPSMLGVSWLRILAATSSDRAGPVR